MHETVLQSIGCPYCGETIEILVDCSVAQQAYIEGCQVCCCPIELTVEVIPGQAPEIQVARDDD